RERGARRLLHHVAELAGDLDLALARHARGLDEEDRAAERRPREPGGHAGDGGALGDLALELRLAEVLDERVLADDERRNDDVRLLPRDLEGRRTAELLDLAVELPDAGLPRVVADDGEERVVGDVELPAADAVLGGAFRQEVPLRDVHLLVRRVAGELDDL